MPASGLKLDVKIPMFPGRQQKMSQVARLLVDAGVFLPEDKRSVSRRHRRQVG